MFLLSILPTSGSVPFIYTGVKYHTRNTLAKDSQTQGNTESSS